MSSSLDSLGTLKRYRSRSMEDIDKAVDSSTSPTDVMDIPEELWAYLLTFVEDIDLQTLCRVNHLLRRLASDKILWRTYISLRNRARVGSRLFVYPQRPCRKDLVEWNILRTTPFREDDNSVYINSPARVANWNAQQSLRKFFIFKSLRKSLEERPPLKELTEKNVIPTGVKDVDEANSHMGGCCCSPKLVPKALRLTKAFREDKLKKSLRKRITIDNLRDSGLSKTHTVTKYCAYHPTLLATQIELDKKLTSARINNNLNHRPSVQSLESMKVLRTDPTTALMLCPPIKPKLRFFEDLVLHAVAVGAEQVEVVASII